MPYDPRGARLDTPCPVVRVEKGRFERLCDVSGGLRIMEVVSFDAELSWIREGSCAAVVVDGDGDVVYEGTTYSDFYGFLTCVDQPLGVDAADLVRRFDVRQDGRLRVEVRLDVRDTPAIADAECREGATPWRRGFNRIPEDWCRAPEPALAAIAESWAQGRPVPCGTGVPYLGVTAHPTVVLFESRMGLDVALQAASLAGAVAPLLRGVPEPHAALAREAIGTVLADIAGTATA